MTERIFYKEDFIHKKASEALLSGDMEEWNNFRKGIAIQDGKIYKVLPNHDLSGANLSEKILDGYNFANEHLEKANLSGSSFKGANFTGVVFKQANLENADLSGANLTNASLKYVELKNINLSKITQSKGLQLQNGKSLNKINFSESDFSYTSFVNCIFINCDFRATKLKHTQLAGTVWEGAIINKDTCIEMANFQNHAVTRDKSETIKCDSWAGQELTKYAFNWSAIRFIGAIPLFEFSWVLLIGLLFLVNSIAFLNKTTPKVFEGLNYIPVPANALYLIISTLLLATASTLYKICCPEKIKAFSETEWVYEHQHPRIEYLIESLQKPLLQAVTFFLLVIGGGIGLWFSAIKIWHALIYAIMH